MLVDPGYRSSSQESRITTTFLFVKIILKIYNFSEFIHLALLSNSVCSDIFKSSKSSDSVNYNCSNIYHTGPKDNYLNLSIKTKPVPNGADLMYIHI